MGSHRTTRAEAIAELLHRLADFTLAHRELIDAVLSTESSRSRNPDLQVEPKEIAPDAAVIPESEHSANHTTHQDTSPLQEPHQTPGDPPASLHEIPSTLDPEEAAQLLRIGNGVAPRPQSSAPTAPKDQNNSLQRTIIALATSARFHSEAAEELRECARRPNSQSAAKAVEARRRHPKWPEASAWLRLASMRDVVEPAALRHLRVRYDALAHALEWLGEFVDDHPEVSRLDVAPNLKLDLRDRLQAVATAQCGVRTEMDSLRMRVPGVAGCTVQDRTFYMIREIVHEDALAMILNDLSLADTVSAEESETLIAEIRQARSAESAPPARRSTRASTLPEPSAVPGHPPSEEPKERFTSVRAAFDAARDEFGGAERALVFTEAAAESASDTAFRRPDEVFDALAALATVAEEWHAAPNGAMGKTFLQRLRELGFEERLCSSQTVSRYTRHYLLRYEGKMVPIGLHMTLGSRDPNTCLSIHWWRDEANRRIVIGHCGKHLPNTLT